MEQDLKRFLKKYNKTEAEFKKTRYQWSDLLKIAEDYSQFRKKLIPVAQKTAGKLQQVKEVHSVRYRIKDEEHLIEKIIRKRLNDPRSEKITKRNYRKKITDLVGMRALHIYKSEWLPIHNYIVNTWKAAHNKDPLAYIGKGDDREVFEEEGLRIGSKDVGYRSIHYIVESQVSKEKFFMEVQTRTIFEEGWSEIDHQIRYPYFLEAELLRQSMTAFNILARGADEMGSFVKSLKEAYLRVQENIEELEKTKKSEKEKEEAIKRLEKRIARLEKKEPGISKMFEKDLAKISEAGVKRAEAMFVPIFSATILGKLLDEAGEEKKKLSKKKP